MLMSNKTKFIFSCLTVFLVFTYTSNCFSKETLQNNKNSSDSIEVISFDDVKTGCFRIIYFIHRNISVWEWSEEKVKTMLKTKLEPYLLWFNTAESIQLLSLYESVDWEVDKMIEIHSLPEYSVCSEF